MKLKLWVATIGALLAVPVVALAQQAPRSADPADPRAAVPPAVYESAISNISRSQPENNQVTPDKVWRTANDTVAGAQVHAGHGAGGAATTADAHASHAPATHTGHVPAAQAAPAPSAKPVDQPPADHSKHH